ncbi:hypothetical protein Tco_0997379 [Tanacetum coccineum]
MNAKRQRTAKDSLSENLSEQPQTYSSQRHRQGSRRLLEDILVNCDGYQLSFTPLSNLLISQLSQSAGLNKFACKLDSHSSLLVQREERDATPVSMRNLILSISQIDTHLPIEKSPTMRSLAGIHAYI